MILVTNKDKCNINDLLTSCFSIFNQSKSFEFLSEKLCYVNITENLREEIVEGMYQLIYGKYQLRAVYIDSEGANSVPLSHYHELERVDTIGMYQNLSNGEQTHIVDFTKDQMNELREFFKKNP